jgi:hypothetical protein
MDNIQLEFNKKHFYQQEVGKVMKRPPSFLLRYGIMIYLFVVILITALMNYITIPNQISVKTVVTPQVEVLSIKTNPSEKIVTLKVANGSYVRIGDTIYTSMVNNERMDYKSSMDGVFVYSDSTSFILAPSMQFYRAKAMFSHSILYSLNNQSKTFIENGVNKFPAKIESIKLSNNGTQVEVSCVSDFVKPLLNLNDSKLIIQLSRETLFNKLF